MRWSQDPRRDRQEQNDDVGVKIKVLGAKNKKNDAGGTVGGFFFFR